MTEPCVLAFLDVRNADSIVIMPPHAPVVVVDIPEPEYLQSWLEEREQHQIAVIYITHEHKDHTPTLSNLIRFVDSWRKDRSLRALCLPDGMTAEAFKRVKDPTVSETQREMLVDVLQRLDVIRRNLDFDVTPAEVRLTPDVFGDVELEVLHPDAMFRQEHTLSRPGELNERSVVLRVAYGRFQALLTGDIEGRGLRELLRRCDNSLLKCHILKIPHHGAWQVDEASFRDLLTRADPELAVLSVGSRNPYGHVAPELFSELLRRQGDKEAALQAFVCTEVTRTCVCLAKKRAKMKKQGLPSDFPCMGDVIIEAEYSGKWELQRRREHQEHIDNAVARPACRGRADLRSLPKRAKRVSKRVSKK